MRDLADPVDAPMTGSAAPPLLAAGGLRYVAGGQRLIDIGALTVRAGRRTVILGANGAGKSLLLRLLHGLIAPTEGQILWMGRPLDRAARRSQALVFQRPVMLRRTVRANLRFALAVRGIGGAERKRRELAALRLAGLEHLARRPARVLSSGEQQRLAIARALATRPELLLLDEPTASLDPAATLAIEDQINAAHAAGVSIVAVTHDPGQARRLGDDVIFLHGGRVAEAGPARQVLASPESAPARAWLDGRLYVDPPTT